MKLRVAVRPFGDGDLRVGNRWRSVLTLCEIDVYEALALAALKFDRLELTTLASRVRVSQVRFVDTMYRLQKKGLLTGLPDKG